MGLAQLFIYPSLIDFLQLYLIPAFQQYALYLKTCQAGLITLVYFLHLKQIHGFYS